MAVSEKLKLDKIKRKALAFKPKVVSAFVVYVTPRESPIQDPDPQFDIVTVDDPDDPLLPRLCGSSHQLREARKAMADRRWNILVALKDGEPVGRIWETIATEKARFSGVPRIRLADDEFFMFDLWVEREYRRGGLASTMAHAFFTKYDPEVTHMTCGYGFVSYDNVPSILWHHSVGFQIAQTMNYLSIGDSIKWKIPFSEMPRSGPMSRVGRHTDKTKDTFGPPLFP